MLICRSPCLRTGLARLALIEFDAVQYGRAADVFKPCGNSVIDIGLGGGPGRWRRAEIGNTDSVSNQVTNRDALFIGGFGDDNRGRVNGRRADRIEFIVIAADVKHGAGAGVGNGRRG